MTAAIYARKSTEQNGVADDQKSVARQIEQARAFASSHGWLVDDGHVYADDGISGAEFTKRPEYMRLLNGLKRRAQFDVLIVSELSRLGREQMEVGYGLKQLDQAGVRVFSYLDGREVAMESATDKFMLSAVSFAAEIEREKARQRTHDAMLRKARAGHVTGGRVFGYDNTDVLGADGKRSHVERRINAAEAAIVVRIFELCAAGKGLKAIAIQLNAEHVPSPRAQQGRPHAWVASSVRDVLYRPLYRGVIVWNQTRKRDQWGKTKQHARPAADRIEVPAPTLRIVSDERWAAAHDRLAAARGTYLRGTNGHLWGRPATGIESKYLLTGLARCASCGGTLTVRSRSHGKRRAHFYACSSFHHRGRAVCPNSLEMHLQDADEAVLVALEGELLDAEIIEEAMARALANVDVGRSGLDTHRERTARALEQVRTELNRLTDAIAAGGDVATIVAAIRERERRRDTLERELRELDRPAPTRLDAARAKAALDAKLTEWKTLLREHAPKARQMLRKLLTGRIVFTPDRARRRYTFTAQGTVSRFFNGLVHPQGMASPSGCAARWKAASPWASEVSGLAA